MVTQMLAIKYGRYVANCATVGWRWRRRGATSLGSAQDTNVRDATRSSVPKG